MYVCEETEQTEERETRTYNSSIMIARLDYKKMQTTNQEKQKKKKIVEF
jgi:hypothetical protein